MSYYAPMVAALVTLVLITMILCSKFGKQIHDIPNERSLHTRPIPRTGGVGLMAGTLVGFGLTWHPSVLTIAVCVFFLVIVSFLDDLSDLSAGWRLLIHFIVAGVYLGLVLPSYAGWLVISTLIILTVWMINLYNFMDGSDGLAGGMALFGFGSYALAAWLAKDVGLFQMNACIAAAALSFLFFNFYPARIFMGDSGSIPLGFLAAAFGVVGVIKGLWPVWFPLMVFAPFIIDASVTLTKRMIAGDGIWQAHRSHYYQRLILMGWGHKATAAAEYVLMATTAATAIWMLREPARAQVWCLLAWSIIYIGLMLSIDTRWRRYQKLQSSETPSGI
jgi:UDP-GlcNAc:undecaprenyl-phosphate/decaprenyl-phosphate GlcNAc-1-phosphate transferase